MTENTFFDNFSMAIDSLWTTENLAKVPELFFALLITVLTLTATVYIARKKIKHSENSLKHERLRLIKELIDAKGYSIAAYRLVVEETFRGYVGYYVPFVVITSLFKTSNPSKNLASYTDFHHNIQVDGEKKLAYSFSNTKTPWIFGVEKLMISACALLVSSFAGVAAIAMANILSFENSINQNVIIFSVFAVITIISVMSIFVMFVLLERGLTFVAGRKRIDTLLNELNKTQVRDAINGRH